MISDYPIPNFPGWRKLGPEELVKIGDRFVNISPFNIPKSPAGGSDASGSEGQMMRTIVENNRHFYNGGKFPYWIYRKGTDGSIPRRLIGSRMFSAPLPLP